ncbi:MAG: L,D-transpeptidase family protein [Steroidobacteraceae bacterium]|jgi:L,D-transpeptidase ErfK/SrfK|nr:L,D-transpeptidase family protein [Steroidobacteraceae bacterium]
MRELSPILKPARIAAIVAAALLVTACTPFESLWRKEPPAAAPSAPPAKPELPLAQATHRFIVEPGTDVVGRLQVTVATREDTLPDIARRFNVGYEEIVRANPGVDPWLPGEGTEIALPTRFVLPDAPREGVVINLPAMRLFYYLPRKSKDAPLEVITHPIGIGKVGWKTPEGRTKVTQKTKDPTWTPPLSVRREHEKNGDPLPAKVPPGPDNPLGRHAMRLGWPTYLIHGTNKPYGVGMRASAGCIRLYPEDIAEVFDLVGVGTPVLIVNQPFLLGWAGDQLHVQAYDVMEDDERDWSQGPKALRKKGLRSKSSLWKRIAAADGAVNWELAHEVARNPLGIPVPVMKGREQRSEALLAAAPRVRNALPAGATWDGNEDQYAGEERFREMLAEREPERGGQGAAP